MTIIDDVNSGKYNFLILGVVAILFFHIYWNKNSEPMADVGNLDQIKEAVKQVYMADVEAIRNLSNVATQLQAGGLTAPGNLTVKGELLTASGNFRLGNVTKDQWIFHSPPDERGGLWIARVQRDGNVNWPNGLNLLTSPDGTQNIGGNFNIIPRGTIVAWTGATPPVGWALCNGQNGTPDLRNKFVAGAGADYAIGVTGGKNTIQLAPNQIPPHRHYTAIAPPHWNWGDGYLGNGNKGFSGGGGANFGTGGQPFLTGDGNDGQSGLVGAAIDIRPQFYALAYIMKL